MKITVITVFPAKRYMITKKKRSLGNVHRPEELFAEPTGLKKSKLGSGFDRRYTGGSHLF